LAPFFIPDSLNQAKSFCELPPGGFLVALPEGVGDSRLSFYFCFVIYELFRSLKQVVDSRNRLFLLSIRGTSSRMTNDNWREGSGK
jgi:hypothetical protein